MKIFAIGGGGNGCPGQPYEIKDFDMQITKLTKQARPRLLFVSFAQCTQESADAYFEIIKRNYEALGCQCAHLSDKDLQKSNVVAQKIKNTDIIYVGGGNTLRLMQKLRRYGIDKMLGQAKERDVVLCGVSAGAICWCNYGNSDSRKFTSNSIQLIKVTGLGFVNVLLCPHYDVEAHRQDDLKRMMHRTKGVAIALENCVALKIIDDKYTIEKTLPNAKAYKCYWQNGKYLKKELASCGNTKQLITKE